MVIEVDSDTKIIKLKSSIFEVTLLSLGATLQSFKYKGDEMTLNYPISELIERRTLNKSDLPRDPYYGCIAGRVANRICNGKFILDSNEYNLAINNGPNALHGGLKGFDSVQWKIISNSNNEVTFKYISEDQEEGYPGTLEILMRYMIIDNNDDSKLGKLIMDYEAQLLDNIPTIINLTNHTYWNLSGITENITKSHNLTMNNCKEYLPISGKSIPLGFVKSVKDSPFDYIEEKSLSQILERGNNDNDDRVGIDHCYIINRSSDKEIKNSMNVKGIDGNDGPILYPVATLKHTVSGRQMTVETSLPGVQVYTANWLELVGDKDGDDAISILKKDDIHYQHNAICLETQYFPDSINQPADLIEKYNSNVILRPGKVYRHRTVHNFLQ